MRRLRYEDYRQVPWRNGRGSTAEIAVEPPFAGPEDFLWRVSMAQVAEDGPFSQFAGVDRVLTVIEGGGLALAVADRPPVLLGDAPFAFPGDLPCVAHLLAGPVVDLNVMTRRGRCRAVVRATGADALPGAAHRLVFAAWGALEGRVGDRPFSLAPRETLRLTGAEGPTLALTGTWLDIQILPHTEGPRP